jgi:hypothetical protein
LPVPGDAENARGFGRFSMSDCLAIRDQLALLLYAELSFDEEERVEAHLDSCAECRAALERQRAFHRAFDTIEVQPSPSLLRECREDLFLRLREEAPVPPPHRLGWWDRIVDALTLNPAAGMLRPAGALTLIALGFTAARMLPVGNFSSPFGMAGMEPMGAARVRYVEPASDGRVQIVLDETRQRVVLGNVDEDSIRSLLLTAAKDPSDPGLRAETVEILNTRAQSAEIRDLLMFALEHDQNAGVRMKAMEGLKSFSEQPEVRAALTHVLLSDSNPGMRTQAIDLLTASTNTTDEIDRQIVGTLQELMQRGERQGYVRERCLRVLDKMNASSESY